jgi:hypothetical protein
MARAQAAALAQLDAAQEPTGLPVTADEGDAGAR